MIMLSLGYDRQCCRDQHGVRANIQEEENQALIDIPQRTSPSWRDCKLRLEDYKDNRVIRASLSMSAIADRPIG